MSPLCFHGAMTRWRSTTSLCVQELYRVEAKNLEEGLRVNLTKTLSFLA